MSSIIILHPRDTTTDFLCEISNSITSKYKENVVLLRPEFTKESHLDCVQELKDAKKDQLIIFLGHGASNCLCGSTNGEFSYHDFILEEALNIFENQRVVLISCRSEEYLKKYHVGARIIASIGFGDLPTETEEIDTLQRISAIYDQVNQKILDRFKSSLNEVISASIIDGIEKQMSFMELYNRIRLRINKKISEVLIVNKSLENRKLATLLSVMKTEMKYFGNASKKVFY